MIDAILNAASVLFWYLSDARILNIVCSERFFYVLGNACFYFDIHFSAVKASLTIFENVKFGSMK